MVKKTGFPKNIDIRPLLALCCAGFAVACSTARPGPDPVEPAAPSLESSSATLEGKVTGLWSKRLKSYVSDIAVSADGKSVLVASAPNFDIPDGAREYRVRLLDSDGDEQWSLRPSAPVKSLAISGDGKVAILATYDDTITAYDDQGRSLWSIEATCRPLVLPLAAKFVCYHDDDAEPRVAFDVFDLKGAKLHSYPIQKDVLALKVSRDERNLAIALDGGQVILFGPDYKPVWERVLPGEVSDLDVTSGTEPRVAALYQPEFHAALQSEGGARSPSGQRRRQKLAWLGEGSKHSIEAEPAQFCEQIAFSDDGNGIVVHGNGSQGQYLALFAPESGALKSRWTRWMPHFSDNSARVMVGPGQVIVGFEESTPSGRQSRLMSLDPSRGSSRWSVPVTTDEGAYLYTDGIADRERKVLVIGSDDGRVSAFRFD